MGTRQAGRVGCCRSFECILAPVRVAVVGIYRKLSKAGNLYMCLVRSFRKAVCQLVVIIRLRPALPDLWLLLHALLECCRMLLHAGHTRCKQLAAAPLDLRGSQQGWGSMRVSLCVNMSRSVFNIAGEHLQADTDVVQPCSCVNGRDRVL